MFEEIEKEIQRLASPKKAVILQKFFKTGKGEYGQGDMFLGLTVPQSRSVAKKFKTLSLTEIKKLLASKFHEYRQIGLILLVMQFTKGTAKQQKEIYEFYLSHTESVNNWDLVDGSAGYIVGEYLYVTKSSPDVLFQLAASKNLWERRIALLATFSFLYHGDDSITYKIVKQLLSDKHDLIQKALGWMLREAGKRVSREKERAFLTKNYKKMGRTALRYAIEHFSQSERKRFLQGTI